MTASLLLQYLVIALAVLVSAWVVFNKQFPTAARRLRGRVAAVLLRQQRPAWIQRLGHCLAPLAAREAGGCSGCSSCGPTPGKRH